MKRKNALRGHFIQEYTPGTETPSAEWLELAVGIVTVGDDTAEETEETAYYDGDGTPENEIISVAGTYTFEGHYFPEDPAQKLIADKKYKVGTERKLWHKVVSSNGEKEHVGRATVSAIIAGAGDASAYEAFSCSVRFDQIPKEQAVTESTGQ